jgi:lipopolysaccharide transport system permease protein
MKESIVSVFKYRGFIFSSVKRDLQAKYQSTYLGAAWLVLQPLSMVLVYTLIFSTVMKARLPGESGFFGYSIYLCSGILTWGLSAEIISRGKNIFLENANLLKKLKFPKLCLIISLTISSVINFSIIFSIFIVFLIVTGNFPGISFFLLFPILALQILFSVGIALILSVLNVFFRDVGQFVDVGLQILFWVTPIVYTIDILPVWASEVLQFNPMAVFVGMYQRILLSNGAFDFSGIYYLIIITCVALLLGGMLLKRHSGNMVDEL